MGIIPFVIEFPEPFPQRVSGYLKHPLFQGEVGGTLIGSGCNLEENLINQGMRFDNAGWYRPDDDLVEYLTSDVVFDLFQIVADQSLDLMGGFLGTDLGKDGRLSPPEAFPVELTLEPFDPTSKFRESTDDALGRVILDLLDTDRTLWDRQNERGLILTAPG
jgi:hypothetical protein